MSGYQDFTMPFWVPDPVTSECARRARMQIGLVERACERVVCAGPYCPECGERASLHREEYAAPWNAPEGIYGHVVKSCECGYELRVDVPRVRMVIVPTPKEQ